MKSADSSFDKHRSLAAIFARIAGVVVAFFCRDNIFAQHLTLRAFQTPRSDQTALPVR